MKKFPKPWFRPNRGVWYVNVYGRQHNLGPDEEAALAKYHALMAAPVIRHLKTSHSSAG
jgi:hypothetical protein